MDKTKQKNRIYFFFSLIFTLLISSCGIRNLNGFVGEDARFANYTFLGNDGDGTAGLAYYADENNPNEIAVGIGTCTAQDIEVSTYDGKPVTQVFPAGFQNCDTIRTIELPDSVTVFGTDAFAGSSLQYITIPNELRVISTGAFRNCRSLTSVTFESGNKLTTINDYAFANDYNLTTFLFHKITNLTSVGKEAFLYCLGLSSVIFPDSFTTLGSYAFQDCKNLKTIYFPASIAVIGSYAFKGVGQDAKIYFSENREKTVEDLNLSDPNPGTTIPFEDDHNFSFGEYHVPIIFDVGSLKIVGPFQFFRPNDGVYIMNECVTDGDGNWSATAGIDYSDTLASDEVMLWSYDDDGTTDLEIPATIDWGETLKVVGIKNNVFNGNTHLRSVTFNENLRFIDYGAFAGCSNLKTINLEGAVDLQHIQSRAFYGTMPITLVSGKYTVSTLYSVHIPANVENIAADAFRNCPGLFKVYFDGASDEYEETFICNGSTQSFELAYVPNSVTSVTVDGPQKSSTLVGKTITITGNAPRAGAVLKVTYTTNSTNIQKFKGHYEGEGQQRHLATEFILSSKAQAIGSITVGGNLVTNYTSEDYDEGTKTKITFASGPDDGAEIIVSYRAKSKLREIEEYAFCSCANGIDGKSFYNFTLRQTNNPFQTLYLPLSLEIIHPYAFSKGSFIGGVVFKSAKLTIYDHAFAEQKTLSSIVFPSSMSETGLNLYEKCFASGLSNSECVAGDMHKKLISVTLPANTTVWDNDIFYGHIMLSIYCINNTPVVENNKTSWNRVGNQDNQKNPIMADFGDFSGSATKDDMDKVPVYTVASADDIISLPNKQNPIFDFVKTKGDNFATLTNFHFYGGRIKDHNGNTAIIPGKTLSTPYSTANINSSYNSEYAVKLDTNGHFRLEIPYQVYINGSWLTVQVIGKSALAIQFNTGSLHPKSGANETNREDTSAGSGSYNYWKDFSNYWTTREITVPNSLTTISDTAMAFVPFTTLKSYDGVSSSKLSTDGKAYIYDDSTNSLSVNGSFPSSLTVIGKKAFVFSGITSAKLPSGLRQFGNITASSGPNNAYAYYHFPFMGCFDLAELSMDGSGVFKASGGVLIYASTGKMIEGAGGQQTIEIPWGTTETVAGAIRGGRNIDTVYFPYTLGAISQSFLDTIGSSRDSAGRSCQSALKHVYFADASHYGETSSTTTSQCKVIGRSAFYGHGYLEDIELPYGLQEIGVYAFRYCTRLNSITIDKGTGTPVEGLGSHLNFTKLPSLTTLGTNCFEACTALTEVTTSEHIGTVPDSAFNICTGLQRATFNSATSTIGKSSFNGCNNLQTITFNGPSSLGSNAFSGCTLLNSVTFNGTVTLGSSAFSGCTSLTDITVPQGSKIYSKAFNGCTGLASGSGVIIGKNVTFDTGATKGNSAFFGCDLTTKIFLMDTYEEFKGSNASHYPAGWNIYTTTGGNLPLDFYCYSATQPENPVSGFHYWEDEDHDGVPHIWQ